MAKEKEKVDQEAALVEVMAKCADQAVKISALQELTELQGKSISNLIERLDDITESIPNALKHRLDVLEKQTDDIVKQFAATRVPVPEKELAEIKKFLVEKYHYKGN